MNAMTEAPFTRLFVLNKLRAAQLRTTMSRIAILQTLENDPAHWFSTEDLYLTMIERGVQLSIATLYRIMNEMVVHDLLLRQVDGNGRRFFRLRPDERMLHRIVCRDTGRVLAETDDISVEHLTAILRSQGLMLADAPITIQIQCQALNNRRTARC